MTLMAINLDGLRTGGRNVRTTKPPNLGGPELVSWLEGVRDVRERPERGW